MATGHMAMSHQTHDNHSQMIADFRQRFWVSLILTVPILALSPMIQDFLGLRAAMIFPGSSILLFVFTVGIVISPTLGALSPSTIIVALDARPLIKRTRLVTS